MVYTSASFIFVFLPFALALYTFVPPMIKKQTLLAISVLFYITANLRRPASIIAIAVITVLTYFTAKWLTNTYIRNVHILYLTLMMILILASRIIFEFTGNDAYYPAGIAVWGLGCISFVEDTIKGEVRNYSAVDMFLYILFFPVILLGPVVGFSDFERAISKAESSFLSFASGIRSFIYGFVEFFTVSVTLYTEYEKLDQSISGTTDVLLLTLTSAVAATALCFGIVGVRKIAAGITRMLGFDFDYQKDRCASVCGISYISGSFLPDINGYFYDYMPDLHKNKKINDALKLAFVVFLTFLWLRTSVNSIICALIAALLVFVFRAGRIYDRVCDKKALRILISVVSLVVLAYMSLFLTDPSLSLWSIISERTDTGSETVYQVYMIIRGKKYISAAAVGAVLVLMKYMTDIADRKFGETAKTVIKTAVDIVIVIMFVFTIVYSMSGYPDYTTVFNKYFIF